MAERTALVLVAATNNKPPDGKRGTGSYGKGRSFWVTKVWMATSGGVRYGNPCGKLDGKLHGNQYGNLKEGNYGQD